MSDTVRIPAALLCGALMLCVYGPASAITVQITQPANHAKFVKGDSETFKGVIDNFGDSYAEYAWFIHEANEVEGLSGGLLQAPGPKYVEHGPWTFTTPSAAVDDAYTILAAAEKETPESAPVNLEFTSIFYTVVGLDIAPNPETKLTCVGLPQSFSANVQPAGVAMTDYQWSIGGQRVKNYVASLNSAVKTDLEAADLGAQAVGFHWVRGPSADVGLSAKLDGRSITAPTQTWTIEEPSDVSFTLTPGPQGNVGVHYHGGEGVYYLDLGWDYADAMGRAGSVTMPTNFGGALAVFQEICLYNRCQMLADNTWWRATTNGDYECDTQFPTVQGTGLSGSPVQVSQGDTPGNGLTGTREMSIAYDFQVWLMFAPEGGRWVPLMAGTWFGNASASLVGGNWTLNSGALGCTTPAATTDYPEWSQTFVGSPAMWQPETP